MRGIFIARRFYIKRPFIVVTNFYFFYSIDKMSPVFEPFRPSMVMVEKAAGIGKPTGVCPSAPAVNSVAPTAGAALVDSHDVEL